MTIRHGTRIGYWAVVAVLGSGSLAPHALGAPPAGPPTAAFLGRDVPDDLRGASAPGLEPGAIYLVRGPGALRPSRIGVRDTEPVREVRLSPRLDRIVYGVTREVSCDPSYSVRVPFAVIADTTGDEIAALPGVASFAWSPDGDKLAVVYGRPGQDECLPDSMGIIALDTRSGTTYPVRCRFVEWLDPSTLLLEGPGITAFDLATTTSKKLLRGGRYVSPDGRYSFTTDGTSAALAVTDDRSHADLTKKIARLLGGGAFATAPLPFWVRKDGSPRLLCVAVRPGPEAAGAARAAAWLIDVEGPKLVRVVPGVPIASTPDGRSVLVHLDGELRFEDP